MMKDKFIEITKIYYKPCYEKIPRNSNKTSIHFENSFLIIIYNRISEVWQSQLNIRYKHIGYRNSAKNSFILSTNTHNVFSSLLNMIVGKYVKNATFYYKLHCQNVASRLA